MHDLKQNKEPAADCIPSIAQNNSAAGWIAALIVVGLLGYWVIVFFGFEFFQAIPYWFIVPHHTPLNIWAILGGLVCLCGVLISLYFSSNVAIKLLAILLMGVVLQFSFGTAKGGLDAIGSRMVHTGHAQFMRLAVNIENIADFIRDYEQLVREGKLGFFAPSKPPGTAITYVVTGRIANFLSAPGGRAPLSAAEKENNLVKFAVYGWTLFSCLPALVIFFLGRRLFEEKTAFLAALLYITTPSVALINLHTDQTFYPLMAVLTGFLVIKARQSNDLLLIFLAGILFFLTSFLSFGLLVLAILFFGILFFHNISKHTIFQGFALFAGFLSATALFFWVFGYDHFERYINATAHHVSVKGWDKTPTTLLLAGQTNLLEYFLWVGLPVSILSVYAAKNVSLRNLGNQTLLTATFTSVAMILLALLLFGKTKAETARLWMFLTPYLCLFAAKAVTDLTHPRRAFALYTAFVVLAQFFAGYLLLQYQDFL